MSHVCTEMLLETTYFVCYLTGRKMSMTCKDVCFKSVHTWLQTIDKKKCFHLFKDNQQFVSDRNMLARYSDGAQTQME